MEVKTTPIRYVAAGPWSRRQRAIISPALTLNTVTSTRQALEIGEPEPLFQQLEMIDQNFLFENGSTPYAILPNGEGYIRARVSGSGVDNPMQIVTHWQSLITWRD